MIIIQRFENVQPRSRRVRHRYFRILDLARKDETIRVEWEVFDNSFIKIFVYFTRHNIIIKLVSVYDYSCL